MTWDPRPTARHRAREERHKQRIMPDDITAVVIDIGGGPLALPGGAQMRRGASALPLLRALRRDAMMSGGSVGVCVTAALSVLHGS